MKETKLVRCLTFVLSAVVTCTIVCGRAKADAPDGEQPTKIDFNHQIQPILASKCFVCHGHDEKKREADLRLDVREAAIADRDGNKAIAPGSSAQSEIYRRIISKDPDELMPPPDSGHTLGADQIALIRRWLDEGAPYARHWSFVKPFQAPLPTVKSADWPRGEIDRFVLAQLERVGLEPAAEADRYTLIRRLSLDLTGLPPTPEQADRFLDDTSNDAYEKVVDHLLASDRFGEHWARMWLDLARYADTKGYEKDQPRKIWRYRDWVIEALNADMPFDQFTMEQLAGDLFESPTPNQLLATAFHRNTMTNDEGGTDNEEFRIAAVKDRVDSTVQIWMGLTMGCAKCHSHKYDPITQQDYYRFLAFFNQTEDADRGDDAPRAATPTREQQERLDALSKALADNSDLYQHETPELIAARERWERELAGSQVWSPLVPESAVSDGRATLSIRKDASVLATGEIPDKDTYTLVVECPSDRVTAIRLEALTDESLERKGPGRNGKDPNFVVSEFSVSELRANQDPRPLKFARGRADFSQKGWDVAGAIDSNDKTGWAVSPKFGEPHVAVFDLVEPLTNARGARLKVTISQQYGNRLVLGRFRLSVSALDPELLKPQPTNLAEFAAIPAAERTSDQQKQLAEAFQRIYPGTAKLNQQIAALEKQIAELKKQLPQTPVMRELAPNRRRKTFVHLRGNFLQKGAEVKPAVPSAFGTLPEDSPKNRLGVARWLVHADNPLTSRVAVNRIWARIFGVGFVETEEDFGKQGLPPSHPELLDWLAVEFRDSHKWSVKQLCKTIVMSATYRQSSRIDPEAHRIDPRNRWLARAPRFRLPAESIRDQALAAAGLLSTKIGGPSVMPPQPPGIWRTTYSKLKWNVSPGEDRYRRGLYTFWRRTSPYPAMLTFDAGSREVCVIRRVRTNTPLQALVTMNDPVFVEAAGALARQIMSASRSDADSRAARGFRFVLIRPPTKPESDRLVQMFQAAFGEFEASPDAAKDLLDSARVTVADGQSGAELAAWTVVASVLLNLDETLMRN